MKPPERPDQPSQKTLHYALCRLHLRWRSITPALLTSDLCPLTFGLTRFQLSTFSFLFCAPPQPSNFIPHPWFLSLTVSLGKLLKVKTPRRCSHSDMLAVPCVQASSLGFSFQLFAFYFMRPFRSLFCATPQASDFIPHPWFDGPLPVTHGNLRKATEGYGNQKSFHMRSSFPLWPFFQISNLKSQI